MTPRTWTFCRLPREAERGEGGGGVCEEECVRRRRRRVKDRSTAAEVCMSVRGFSVLAFGKGLLKGVLSALSPRSLRCPYLGSHVPSMDPRDPSVEW